MKSPAKPCREKAKPWLPKLQSLLGQESLPLLIHPYLWSSCTACRLPVWTSPRTSRDEGREKRSGIFFPSSLPLESLPLHSSQIPVTNLPFVQGSGVPNTLLPSL